MLKRFTIFLLLTFALFTQVNAQTSPADGSSPTDGYFLAPDSSGVIQVWHWGDSPTMLTSASASIVDFAVSHDRLSVVYTSGGQLWLEPLHDAEPFVIADIDPEASPSAYPVFSPDDQLLAYSNNGIWLDRLDGTPPHQIIANIPFDDTTTDVMTLRFYYPGQFIVENSWLAVTVGVWEGRSPGLLDIATGEVVELTPLYAHDKMLVLSDRRLIVYGNSAVSGQPNIEMTTPDKLNDRTTLLDLTTLIPDTHLFVQDIDEIEPGLLRILGYSWYLNDVTSISETVVFDYNLTTSEIVGDMRVIAVPDSTGSQSQTILGSLSPDGEWVSIYVNATLETALDGRGIITGELVLYEVATGELIRLEGFTSVSSFRW